MSGAATIALLPGDGIGPEITDEARRCLEVGMARAGRAVRFTEALIGGRAIDVTGSALPPATVEVVDGAAAVLLGAVGGPKWDAPDAKVRPEQGLLGLRKAMGVWANLRPVAPLPELADATPLKAERLAGVDLVCIRELTGGLYFGEPKGRTALDGGGVRAVDTLVYTDVEIRRVVTLAFRIAEGRRRKVTSIDKANVLESSRLWRQIATEVGRDFPGVTLEHQLVDSAAMRLITAPASFDVIVTENMFGDILTDEAAVLAGSLGLLPSASLGDGPRGLYEPIHGSAPDIAGQGIANPIGTILSAAMLARHSLDADDVARRIEAAVARTIADGYRTADLGGATSTAAMGAAVRERMA
ncbi:MAG: 3-isopropylmalate dehydrogenase [Kofleriaceae bacterium]|nr:3-isopropylmalate dehydrogenase [Myxococcales bacterium]MCB9563229.1 3-isopropylmalate dehydrogenase [Kofleriaceae bacterium]MCB9573589.1 3-isopropylmalate dehydrogenase [Kofleriaceae bacterium]